MSTAPTDAGRRKRLGVIGSFVWDVIHGRDVRRAPVEEWGGITYALSAADAASADVEESPIVDPVGERRVPPERFRSVPPGVDGGHRAPHDVRVLEVDEQLVGPDDPGGARVVDGHPTFPVADVHVEGDTDLLEIGPAADLLGTVAGAAEGG